MLDSLSKQIRQAGRREKRFEKGDRVGSAVERCGGENSPRKQNLVVGWPPGDASFAPKPAFSALDFRISRRFAPFAKNMPESSNLYLPKT
jgi:hypothetical protein